MRTAKVENESVSIGNTISAQPSSKGTCRVDNIQYYGPIRIFAVKVKEQDKYHDPDQNQELLRLRLLEFGEPRHWPPPP